MGDLIRVARNDYYEVDICEAKNYVIVSFFGVWDKSARLDYFISDIKDSLEKISRGFNLIINLNYYRGTASEHIPIHIEAQNLVVASGLNKTAVVLRNNPILKVSVEFIFTQTGINPVYFTDIRAAERWIDL